MKRSADFIYFYGQRGLLLCSCPPWVEKTWRTGYSFGDNKHVTQGSRLSDARARSSASPRRNTDWFSL